MIEKLTGLGWFAAPNGIFERDDLDAYSVLVYLYLCRRAGPDGNCWPSYGTIGRECRISRSTVMRAVERLTEANLLTVEQRTSERGDALSNCYTVLPPVSVRHHPPVSEGNYPGICETLPPVSEGNPNKTQLKENPTKNTLREREQFSGESEAEQFDCGLNVDVAWLAFKSVYPKPFGGLDEEPARRQFHARCMEADCPPQKMINGAKRYREFCERNNMTGGRYVMKAARFLERGERAWERDWDGTDKEAEVKGWLELNRSK